MPTIYKPSQKNTKKNDTINRKIRKLIYNSPRWSRIREWKLVNDPLCEKCKEKDRFVKADDVHHIKSFMQGRTDMERKNLAFDYDNLMSLCKRCHSKEHFKE